MEGNYYNNQSTGNSGGQVPATTSENGASNPQAAHGMPQEQGSSTPKPSFSGANFPNASGAMNLMQQASGPMPNLNHSQPQTQLSAHGMLPNNGMNFYPGGQPGASIGFPTPSLQQQQQQFLQKTQMQGNLAHAFPAQALQQQLHKQHIQQQQFSGMPNNYPQMPMQHPIQHPNGQHFQGRPLNPGHYPFSSPVGMDNIRPSNLGMNGSPLVNTQELGTKVLSQEQLKRIFNVSPFLFNESFKSRKV